MRRDMRRRDDTPSPRARLFGASVRTSSQRHTHQPVPAGLDRGDVLAVDGDVSRDLLPVDRRRAGQHVRDAVLGLEVLDSPDVGRVGVVIEPQRVQEGSPPLVGWPAERWARPAAIASRLGTCRSSILGVDHLLDLALHRHHRAGLVAHDRRLERELAAFRSLAPLVAEQRGLVAVLADATCARRRRSDRHGEVDGTRDRVQLGRLDGRHDRFLVVHTGRALQDIPHPVERQEVAERLVPLLAGAAGELVGERLRVLAEEGRLEAGLGMPAKLAALVDGQVAESLRTLREGERHSRGRQLGVVALLQALLPECGVVARVAFREHDLGAELLVGRDIGGEVLGAHRVEIGEQAVPAGRRQRCLEGRQPRYAKGVVRQQHADLLVGLHLAPHVVEGSHQILSAPERVIGVLPHA